MPSNPAHSSVRAIVGGTVIDPANDISEKLNVFIQDGVILEVSDRKPEEGEGIIDATGMIVTPGFIDMHVHLREPGQEHKETIETGTKSAAAGGFTTIACMPNTNPINDNRETTRYIIQRAGEISPIHVLPVGAISKDSKGKELADIDGMMDEGICALSDDGGCIQDRQLMQRAVNVARDKNILIIEHAEDISASERDSENIIIDRDIQLARESGARIHIAHVSTAEGVQVIREAKADGISVTCEVTPHHLLLTEADVERYGPNAIMKPPLRTEADRQALIESLVDGTIDAIATDHAPHTADEKKNIETSAFGVIGMETMLPVCLKLVHDGSVSMDRFVDSITHAPARILKLKGKGNLSKGSDADVTIFSPKEEITIDSSKFLSKARNTPFDGLTLKGRIIATIVNSNVVYQGS